MKKATLHEQHTFFVHIFDVVLHDYNVKLPVTRFMEEMSYVFSFTFFPLPLIFTLHWLPLVFLILSPPLQNFYVVLPTKTRSRSLSPFFSLSFAGLPSTVSFSLSYSCYIFQIGGHDN